MACMTWYPGVRGMIGSLSIVTWSEKRLSGS